MLFPKLVRLLPAKFRTAVFYKFYRRPKEKNYNLFENASLDFSSGVKMDLFPSDESHRCIAYTGFYEYQQSELIANIARNGGLFIDVGANYGYYSLIWASLNSTNLVHAFEPSPQNFKMLNSNIARNNYGDKIHTHQCSLSNIKDEVFFNDGPKEQTTWGGICKTETESTRVVQSEKIDNLFDLNSRIDVLKIDTEGADFLVLCGAERLLKNKLIKNIFFEMNKPRMKLLNLKVEDAHKYLDSMDYSCSPIGALNNEVMEYHAEPR